MSEVLGNCVPIPLKFYQKPKRIYRPIGQYVVAGMLLVSVIATIIYLFIV